MKFRVLFVLCAAAFAAACSSTPTTNSNVVVSNSNARGSDALSVNSQKPSEDDAAARAAASAAGEPTLGQCYASKVPGRTVVRDQTFVFDHAPFERSCFVTFADPKEMVDAKDVPRGSTFHIFTKGEDVFEFPDAFGGQSACWVEAVSFDDLNKDGKTDVIMAGRCLAARDSYPTNAVFANVGKGFSTNEEANAELDEFENIEQIRAFVTKNTKRFFDN
jgi:hypothetical protein